ncbi:hypothetical protein [Eikenella corrodens]|uniref:Uncharacterized protein n=1 Tax=Eikenella corrodens TaxID=539 RepID=A0A3S9SLL7_EIKCO|nr:hypothetical protein [Eikenella corrodens]AZR60353.1 hypothetical protein ELB75_10240 [Eikenella corrodens]
MGFPQGGGSDTGTLWAPADYSEIVGKLLWRGFVLPQGMRCMRAAKRLPENPLGLFSGSLL